eukprot:TRINITY_DN334_c0_g1_i1.p1 TRINITY_DN334_c0_g1~~TRINITY_DN334_c0_g1_i1.p1  ORF type:complete len:574 (+),score=185.19 TRINITY_DN334_c0_g1_i1:52-1773(+)
MELDDYRDEAGDEGGFDDWVEDEDTTVVKCLFCDEKFNQAQSALVHAAKVHDFDLSVVRARWALDFYDCMKLLNFIRRQALSGPIASFSTLAITSKSHPLFQDESNLQPVLEGDALLFSFDDAEFEAPPIQGAYTTERAAEALQAMSLGDQPTDWRQRAIAAEERTRTLSTVVEELERRLKEQSELTRRLVSIDPLPSPPKRQRAEGTDDDSGSESGEDFPAPASAQQLRAAADGTQIVEDGYYFASYDSYTIHEEMIRDRVRTDSYRKFIQENPEIFAGKVVLDIGCGTGILSMFAAKAGAKHVYAVDMSNMIETAAEVAKANGLDSQITFVKGKAEHVVLPGVDKVDVIISEWMGYFLLYESMLDSVLAARDRWLAPGGQVVPRRAAIMLAACTVPDLIEERVDFWWDVYGFDMKPVRQTVLKQMTREPAVEFFRPEALISSTDCILDIDCNKVRVEQLEFASEFRLEITQEAECHGLLGYFDIAFHAAAETGEPLAATPVSFSTGPRTQRTHWKQTLFHLGAQRVPVRPGDVVTGKLTCKPNRANHRALDVSILYRFPNQPEFVIDYFMG